MKRRKFKGQGQPEVREDAATRQLLEDLSRAVQQERGVEAVRILSRLQSGTLDPHALELAARALYIRALQGYAAGASLNGIISDLSQASRYHPQNPRIWFHLGLAYVKSGLHSKGMWAFRKAADLEPENARYTYHAAWTAVAGQSQDAELWLSRLDSSASEAHFLRASFVFLPAPGKPVFASTGALPSQQLACCDSAAAGTSSDAHAAVVRSEVEPSPALLLLRTLAPSCSSRVPSLEASPVPADPIGEWAALREAAASAPENPVIRLALGNHELRLGSGEAALEYMEAARQGGLQAPELTRCLARLYLRKGAQALREGEGTGGYSYLEQAGILDPDLKPWVVRCRASFLGTKAYRLAAAGDLAAAIPLWKELDKEERSLPILHNLALAYERLKDSEKSVHYWQKWIRARFSPDPQAADSLLAAEARRRLAKCLLESDRPGEAADAYRRVLAQSPDDTDAHEKLARISMHEDEWDQAIQHLEFLQRTQPESSTRWTQIGLSRLMKDDVAGATAAWNRALELEPANEAAQGYLLEALEERLSVMSPKQYATQGLLLIQNLIQLLPRHFAPQLVMARYFYSFNNRKRARDSIERALQLQPQNPLAWTKALHLILDFGTKSDLDRFDTRILDERRHDAHLQERAGMLYLEHGHQEKAKLHFSAAIEDSADSRIPFSIGQAYVRAKDPEEAERYARLALERDPGSGDNHVLLAMALLMQGKNKPGNKQLEIAGSIARETGNEELTVLLEDLRAMRHFERLLFH